jgi:hypothetical protein
MPYPSIDPAVTVVVAVKGGATRIVGDRRAFRAFAEWMQWLASSPASEAFEFDLSWHLNRDGWGERPRILVVESESALLGSIFGEDEQTSTGDISFYVLPDKNFEALVGNAKVELENLRKRGAE